MNLRPIRYACAALAASLLLTSCELAEPLSTEPAVTARFNSGGGAQRLVRGDDGHGISISAVVGPEGADLRSGGHRLVVPPNAVSSATIFTATLTHQDAIVVELTATGVGSVVTNDVGAAGFQRPVKVFLSYKKVLEKLDPSDLRISYVNPLGTLDPLATALETNGRISAELGHFSGYAVTTGREESPSEETGQ